MTRTGTEVPRRIFHVSKTFIFSSRIYKFNLNMEKVQPKIYKKLLAICKQSLFNIKLLSPTGKVS